MADQNQEHAELLARVNQELEMFGRLLPNTSDAVKDMETGVKDYRLKQEQLNKGFGALADAAQKTASAMYNGEQGAKAFNSSIDSMMTAVDAATAVLLLLVPGGLAIKGLIAGTNLLIKGFAKVNKVANEQGDALYTAFQKLSNSGAAAADGTTQLFKDMQNLGLGIQDLDGYVSIMNESSKDLALFGGTVFEGRRKFADMGKAMEGNRESLQNLGLTQQEQNKGAMAYLRLQTRIGQSQNKTTEELAAGATKYLYEMDALTKLTGMQRAEAEEAMESARSEQRFRAKLEELRDRGENERADRLEKANLLLASRSKEAAQGFRDSTTGMLGTEAARKLNMSTQGEGIKQANLLAEGKTNELDAVRSISKAAGKTAKDLNQLGQLGVFNDYMIDFAQSTELGILANKDLAAEQKKIEENQRRQAAGEDPLQNEQTKLRMEQQKGMLATQRQVQQTVPYFTGEMRKLAASATAAAEALNSITGANKTSSTSSTPAAGGAGSAGAAGGPRAPRGSTPGPAPANSGGAAPVPVTPQSRATQPGSTIPGPATGVAGSRSIAPGGMNVARTAGGQSGGTPSTDKPIAEVIAAGPGVTVVRTTDGEEQRREGVRNWRNNNPGNIEFGAFARGQGAIGTDGRFAVFPTLESGKKAKETLLFGPKSKYIDLSIADAIARYAPPSENNTAGYVSNVSQAAGVASSTKMSELNPSQRESFIAAIDKMEGFKVGKIVTAAEGAVLSGPASGYKPNLTMHGTEAIIPLKGGAVPVSMPGVDRLIQEFTKVSAQWNNIQFLRSSSTENTFVDKDPAHEKKLAEIPQYINSLKQQLELLGVNIKSLQEPAVPVAEMRDLAAIYNKLPRMAEGGITSGPTIAGEGTGPEAVIPLKNGAVPVSLNMNDVMGPNGIGPTFAGYNQYTGINQGPMTTDLNAVKDIAAGLGAFDKATQTITDPSTWKEILSTGIATNYELGVAKLGTESIPQIGEEIAARIKELQDQSNVDKSTALKVVGEEFRAAMREAMAEMVRTSGEAAAPGMEHLAGILQELVRTNQTSVDVQKKILQANY
jgi:hypothetical protein